MAKMPEALTVEEHLFTDDGRVPNNPSLPLIVYRAVLEPGPRAAAACEARARRARRSMPAESSVTEKRRWDPRLHGIIVASSRLGFGNHTAFLGVALCER